VDIHRWFQRTLPNQFFVVIHALQLSPPLQAQRRETAQRAQESLVTAKGAKKNNE
jgi:hypothetical protein